jgi:amino-acid N-acetyltransferase
MHIHQQPNAEKVLSLLNQSGLPVTGLQENSFEDFFGCGEKNNPAGIVGVELLEGFGLLRSLVVAKESRGKGCGKSLLETAERYAQSKGLKSLYVLTDTASGFFARMGYLEVALVKVPDIIRNCPEFIHLCSDNAVAMRKDVQVGHFISIYP